MDQLRKDADGQRLREQYEPQERASLEVRLRWRNRKIIRQSLRQKRIRIENKMLWTDVVGEVETIDLRIRR
jgi:hypothetical protein